MVVAARDGIRLPCRDWGGTGPSLLLLHGLAGHGGEWGVLARELTPRFRVVAVDQRGHGRADRRPGDMSRAAFVSDVVAVAGQLEMHRPVLVGQSLGGHTAMLTAAAHPDLVRGLVLVESGPGGENPRAAEELGAWLDSWPAPFPSRAAAVAFFGGGPVGEGWASGLEEHDGAWHPRFDRDVLVEALAENAQQSFEYAWRRVACPVLLVLARTSFLPQEAVDAMLRQRPATRATSVPGTGHDLHLERPDVLRGLIEEFMAGLGQP
ncbi:alpha/beta fold hydrolase [Streptomyces boluensis]|uniref:Alpha/beta fold hydrolase n=1 Tax=Streptomyces boluensis TaxID=1775135 RepID=A0A964XP08_9ACTN|nr:alpha/beta hydrolase [Streptomyces boluensis]NBE54143.1 alpha/beta fold hydrolase [Streptomyces boluensis]